ncbi:dipeptidase (plasmid) [Mesorhizobium sp. AR07]|uniref:dipeptidase n=1 Tax=Mesorhizobium sp. AR07 TaxID=2865838 RepID=UPI00215E1BA7|nr:dipeptidase [Mesorhizobium sp. AR07]UVK49007.1 dipeptidase [Mesorhizobium sp. AR07]
MNISGATRQFWKENLIWDMLYPLEPPGQTYGCPEKYLDHYIDAGVSFTSIAFAEDGFNIDSAVKTIAGHRKLIQARPEAFIHALTVEDVFRAKREGKLAIGMQVHGTSWFGKDVGVLEVFHELGLRIVQIAFNASNFVGGGCSDKADGGLTTYGHKVVPEIERLRMLVDLSHTGYRTTLDIFEIATQPLVISHAGIMGVHQHYRNIRDDQLQALATNGGVVGLSGNSAYIGDDEGSMAAIFRHLDHVVQLVGPDHVGFGFDFVFEPDLLNEWALKVQDEWPDSKASGWKGFHFKRPQNVIELVQLMFDHGYPEEAVRKIVSGNFLRVCQAVW